MWRYVGASVIGSSHLARNLPCQDAHRVGCWNLGDADVFWTVVADGAGSARFSERGAQIICDELENRIIRYLSAYSGAITHLSERVVSKWVARARKRIQHEAKSCDRAIREYACTVTGVIASNDSAMVFQIGDGMVVVKDEEAQYWIIFWPEQGEYINTTFFVTDEGYERAFLAKALPFGPQELAVFTDGLQQLAIHLSSREVHGPFFDPMLRRLALEPPGYADNLQLGLEQFLGSTRINQRTDDDKTLILATQIPLGEQLSYKLT